MRGIKECLNWLIDNPDKELFGSYNDGTPARRRWNEDNVEWYDKDRESWRHLTGLAFFTEIDWQPYDPNPEVEFHVAYMDCLENGSKYLNAQGDISLTRENGKVGLVWNIEDLVGYDLNHGKWKKVL